MKVARFVTRCVYEVGRRIAWFVIGFSTLVTCSRTAQPNTKVNLHQTVETVKVDTQPANPQNYIYIYASFVDLKHWYITWKYYNHLKACPVSAVFFSQVNGTTESGTYDHPQKRTARAQHGLIIMGVVGYHLTSFPHRGFPVGRY